MLGLDVVTIIDLLFFDVRRDDDATDAGLLFDGRIGEVGAVAASEDGMGDTWWRGDNCDIVSGASSGFRVVESTTVDSGTVDKFRVVSGSISSGADALSAG